MQNDPSLRKFIGDIVQEQFGADLDGETRDIAEQDLIDTFLHLFNARLLAKLNDDQLSEVEAALDAKEFDKIPTIAHNSGIDMTQFIADVMVEFRTLYGRH